ncbi:MAG: hypothetical protein HKN05_19540 [Rhizobiales bacterium]|nr:hypothetical protein [Hyphomicrobiales bacterium]
MDNPTGGSACVGTAITSSAETAMDAESIRIFMSSPLLTDTRRSALEFSKD